jgi:SOS regulatory protein LexA
MFYTNEPMPPGPARRLTDLQRRVLEAVEGCLERGDPPPTLAEIGAELGGMTAQAVRPHILALARKGLIRHDHRTPRSIRLIRPGNAVEAPVGRGQALPIAGAIAGGAPIERTSAEPVWIDERWGGQTGNYILRVRGFALAADGLLDADLVVIEPATSVEDGALALVSLVGGAVTIKRLLHSQGIVRLQPANPFLESTSIAYATVLGRIRAVIRDATS